MAPGLCEFDGESRLLALLERVGRSRDRWRREQRRCPGADRERIKGNLRALGGRARRLAVEADRARRGGAAGDDLAGVEAVKGPRRGGP